MTRASGEGTAPQPDPPKPLAYGQFQERRLPNPADPSPAHVVVHVYEGQENLHIDGEYAIYRRTDGPRGTAPQPAASDDLREAAQALFDAEEPETVTHDDRCESEFLNPPGAYTACDCGYRNVFAARARLRAALADTASQAPAEVLWEGPAKDVDIVEQGRLPSVTHAVGWDGRVRVVTVPEGDALPEFARMDAALADARVVVWFCPVDHRHIVEWSSDDDSMTPRCVTCGLVGPTRQAGPVELRGDDTGEHDVIECNRPAHQDGHHTAACYGTAVPEGRSDGE